MRRKYYGKKAIGYILALSMLTGLTACGNNGQQAENEEVNKEQTGGEADGGTVEETSEDENNSSIYTMTEENGNQELTMNRQPEASYWFPAQLLEWNAEEDEDLIFNVSTVPLAERVDTAQLETVNNTQNKDTKVMAVSIMNGSTSGNSPHGLNKVNANTFSYWQYVDLLVYWAALRVKV